MRFARIDGIILMPGQLRMANFCIPICALDQAHLYLAIILLRQRDHIINHMGRCLLISLHRQAKTTPALWNFCQDALKYFQ